VRSARVHTYISAVYVCLRVGCGCGVVHSWLRHAMGAKGEKYLAIIRRVELGRDHIRKRVHFLEVFQEPTRPVFRFLPCLAALCVLLESRTEIDTFITTSIDLLSSLNVSFSRRAACWCVSVSASACMGVCDHTFPRR